MVTDANPYHSRPLDVHRWSDHREIKELVDRIWPEILRDHEDLLEKKGNRKPLSDAKTQLRTLITDLYVAWLDDPELWVAIKRGNGDFSPTSRYNALHVSKMMPVIVDALMDTDYLDHVPFSNDRTYGGRFSRTSRYRANAKLQGLFKGLTVTLFDIEGHKKEETIVLTDFETDEEGKFIKTSRGKKWTLIEYKDEDYPLAVRMRSDLHAYNELLRLTHVDIASLDKPLVIRIKAGGKPQRISINQLGKWVRRIFSRGSWELNGRFYGGWWQLVGEELRKDILIDGSPTIEVDFKGFHVSMLANEAGVLKPFDYDWYDLEECLIPDIDLAKQRKVLKLLVLTAINASSVPQAFRAYRDKASGSLNKSTGTMEFPVLKDRELGQLLSAFLDRHPYLAKGICSDRGIGLMYQDSLITGHIINDFVAKGEPILSVHDSYIVKRDAVIKLRDAMNRATKSVINAKLAADQEEYSTQQRQQILNQFRQHDYDYFVSLSLDGYLSPKHTVQRTKRYENDLKKFMKWKASIEPSY